MKSSHNEQKGNQRISKLEEKSLFYKKKGYGNTEGGVINSDQGVEPGVWG